MICQNLPTFPHIPEVCAAKVNAAKVILDNVSAGNADSDVNTRLYKGILMLYAFSSKIRVPPPDLNPMPFFANEDFRKKKKQPPLNPLGTRPSAKSKDPSPAKKNGTALCASF